METSELIRRASNRDISTYDNLSLYFDTVRLETDFEKARPHYERIYDIAAQQKVKFALSDQQTAIKFYELAKKAALMLAPRLFHYYLLYVEWDREPQKKFYVPRMNVLKLSEQEKYQKLMEEAAQIKAENTRLLNRTKVQEKFVKAGIKEECYSPLLDSIVTDDEGKSLAFAESLIASFSANAAAAAEAAKQAAMQTPAPNPGAIGNAASAQEQYNKVAQNGSILDIIKAADAVHGAKNIPTD